MIEIPAAFTAATVAREGRRSRAWVDRLPVLLTELLDRWRCVPSGPVTHGLVAVVLPVRRADGSGAVLKVSWPHSGNRAEPDALATWDGNGAARLLERDDDVFAMLLERLRPRSAAELRDPFAAVAAAGRLARRLAVPAPPSLPRLDDIVGRWVADLPTQARLLGDPLPRAVVDAAVATARELGASQPDLVVHGDLHPGNILRGRREPWLVIDPKGFAGDPAYDAVTLLRTCWPALVRDGDARAGLTRAVDVFAETAAADRERVRRWAQARAVVDSFWSRQHGEPAEVTAVCDELATALTDQV